MNIKHIKTLATIAGAASLLIPLTAGAAASAYGSVGTTVNAALPVSTSVNANATVMASSSGSSSSNASVSGETQSSQGTQDSMNTPNPATTNNDSALMDTDVSVGGLVTIGRSDATSDTGVDISDSAAVATDADAQSYARSVIKSDPSVSSVAMSDTDVQVSYKEPAKFLGLFNSSVTVTADANASGAVSVSYPWYTFLLKTDDASLAADAQARVQSTGVASASADATLTAQQKAALVDALHAALQAQAQSSATVQADGSANGSY